MVYENPTNMCLTTAACSMAQEDLNKVFTLKQLNDNRIAYLFYSVSCVVVVVVLEMDWNATRHQRPFAVSIRPDECGLFASLTSAIHKISKIPCLRRDVIPLDYNILCLYNRLLCVTGNQPRINRLSWLLLLLCWVDWVQMLVPQATANTLPLACTTTENVNIANDVWIRIPSPNSPAVAFSTTQIAFSRLFI